MSGGFQANSDFLRFFSGGVNPPEQFIQTGIVVGKPSLMAEIAAILNLA